MRASGRRNRQGGDDRQSLGRQSAPAAARAGPEHGVDWDGARGRPTRVLAAHFHSSLDLCGRCACPRDDSPPTRMLEEFRFREVTDATSIYGVVGSPLIAFGLSGDAQRRVSGGGSRCRLPAARSLERRRLHHVRHGARGAGREHHDSLQGRFFERADEVDELSQKGGCRQHLSAAGAGWEARNTDVSGFLAPLAGRLNLRRARARHSGDRRCGARGGGGAGLGG